MESRAEISSKMRSASDPSPAGGAVRAPRFYAVVRDAAEGGGLQLRLNLGRWAFGMLKGIRLWAGRIGGWLAFLAVPQTLLWLNLGVVPTIALSILLGPPSYSAAKYSIDEAFGRSLVRWGLP
jgi:hypothetical protein